MSETKKETPSVPELETSPTVEGPAQSVKHDQALHWFQFGLKVIPITPGTKIPAVGWDDWFKNLSSASITKYWADHPDHDIAFLVGEEIIVLDADAHEAVTALNALERKHHATPLMVTKTSRGEHHYFRRIPAVYARTDSHSTKDHPERIDVKTGRTLVTLPPSTGKELVHCHVKFATELFCASQEFVDAIFQHNGRPVPRRAQIAPSPSKCTEPSATNIERLKSLVEHISPDCGYEDWLHVLMALYHETGGGDDGFGIADTWSSKGTSYAGEKDIRTKWDSFKSGTGNPITIGTLIKMAKENGADISAIMDTERFEVCETVVVKQSTAPDTVEGAITAAECTSAKSESISNPLDKFSLLGKSAELEKNAVDEVFVLGEIALKGQATAIYAAPNTGKTLIVIWLITQGISARKISPHNLYYLNMDDTASGLREKARLADEYGFHILAEGHADFEIKAFLGMVNEMIQNDQCRDVIIVLDTLKKFTNLMDKGVSSGFANVIRRFVVKGGTLIALAHTNKNPGRNGKPVYSGTTDIVDDFDCAYILAKVSEDQNAKIVEFENFKRRGNVAPSAAYSYSIERGISYSEILLSVKPVDPLQLEPIKQAEAIKSDAEVIAAVLACIKDGVNTKMKLADAAAARAGISKRSTLQILEKYTGNDPAVHRWEFDVRERGAKVFVALEAAMHKPESAEP